MLGILTMCAMTSLLAAVIVSYMELRMIQNDSIEDNMKMYLDQITKNTDEAMDMKLRERHSVTEVCQDVSFLRI